MFARFAQSTLPRDAHLSRLAAACCLCFPFLFAPAAPALAQDGNAVPTIKLLTARENPSLGPRTAVILHDGPIAAPMAEELLKLRDELRASYDTVILDLHSPGGEIGYTEEVVAILRLIREDVTLRTFVRNGSNCLSACVVVFLQGEERIAGGASAWLFHGVCNRHSERPSSVQTQRFVDLMVAAGVSETFLCTLIDKGYLTEPGNFWVSGYELFHLHNANVITRLLEPWQPDGTPPPPAATPEGPERSSK
jgi:hypothetical protein